MTYRVLSSAVEHFPHTDILIVRQIPFQGAPQRGTPSQSRPAVSQFRHTSYGRRGQDMGVFRDAVRAIVMTDSRPEKSQPHRLPRRPPNEAQYVLNSQPTKEK